MKPSDYIANLKRERSKASIKRDSLPDWVLADLQKTASDVDSFLSELSSSDRAEELLSNLKPRLASWLQELLSTDLIVVGEVEDPHPNAYVKFLGEDGYAIVFNSGLTKLLYRVARILATRFVSSEEGEREPTPEFQETARLIAEVFWWLRETGQSFGPDYPIRLEQAKMASLLTTEAETFLIAHEIGHVIDDASKHANPIFSKLDQTLTLGHREEHTADAMALVMVMELHDKGAQRDPFQTPLIYAGAEFALQVYSVLEHLNFELAESHPAATRRLNFIRSEMKRVCASKEAWTSMTALSSGIDALFAEIIGIVNDPGQHGDFFERQANQVISELNRLLDQCSGGFVPDYAHFHIEAVKIFDTGYSHIFLEKVAQIANEFFAAAETSNSVNGQQTWVRFQKFKLLFSFAREHMPEPARSLFLRALRMS
jgi:hypothetical protein